MKMSDRKTLVTVLMLMFAIGCSLMNGDITKTYAAEEADAEQIYQDGVDAYNMRRWNVALEKFSTAAEQGDARAQNFLGIMYEEGYGMDEDYDLAVKYYMMSAEQGNANAQYNLGLMYYDGVGVEQDLAEAAKWFSEAAAQSHEDAQAMLDRIQNAQEENAAAAPVREGDYITQEYWNWSKGYFNDGMMYIYSDSLVPGTEYDADGREVSSAYIRLYQDKDSFFAVMCNDTDDYYNNLDESISVKGTLIWDSDYKQEFDADMSAGNSIVWFSATATGYMDYALNLETGAAPWLVLTYPGGQEFQFQLWNDPDYETVKEMVWDYWYVPTYTADIYAGDDVNPELVSFLEDFEKAAFSELDAREKKREADREEIGADTDGRAGTALAYDILTLSDGGLSISASTDLGKKYLDMDGNLPRTVDAEYYYQYKAEIDARINEFNVNYASEIVGDVYAGIREYGNDDMKQTVETIEKGAEFLQGLWGLMN